MFFWKNKNKKDLHDQNQKEHDYVYEKDSKSNLYTPSYSEHKPSHSYEEYPNHAALKKRLAGYDDWRNHSPLSQEIRIKNSYMNDYQAQDNNSYYEPYDPYESYEQKRFQQQNQHQYPPHNNSQNFHPSTYQSPPPPPYQHHPQTYNQPPQNYNPHDPRYQDPYNQRYNHYGNNPKINLINQYAYNPYNNQAVGGYQTTKTPKFFLKEGSISLIAFLVALFLFLGFALSALFFSLIYFHEPFAKLVNNENVAKTGWPIFLLVYPGTLFSFFYWVFKIINFAQFRAEKKRYANDFPIYPTNWVQKIFLKLHGSKINWNYFSISLYATAAIVIGVILLFIFSMNKITLKPAEASEYFNNLVAYLRPDKQVQFKLFIILFSCFVIGWFIFHMIVLIIIKVRLSRIETFYGTIQVVSIYDLTTYKSKIKKRNMILCLIWFATIFFLIALGIWRLRKSVKK